LPLFSFYLDERKNRQWFAMSVLDPHAGHAVLRQGPDPSMARLTVILLHGRGASADSILGLAREFQTNDVAYLAPQAAGSTWYPYSFLAPMSENEPGLSSALNVIGGLMSMLERQQVPPGHIAMIGFSQGACLALEFAARHPRRYAAVAGLSGGLIGPPGTARDYPGSLEGAPVFLGCSDIDAHIPLERVHESAGVFRRLGASVDARIYPGMGHTVNLDEIEAVRALLSGETPPATARARI
jgi:predicted esterase